MPRAYGGRDEREKIERLEEGNLPPHIQKYGSTKEEIFADLSELRWFYGERADQFATGAIGVYSYLKRIAFGLQHFAALNRKFDVSRIDASDLIPLTRKRRKSLGEPGFPGNADGPLLGKEILGVLK